jgi:hypothetical protein
VTGDRARGALLYGSAAAILVAGGLWWFRSAPADEGVDKAEAWRQSAEQYLPDVPEQVAGDTIELAAGVDQEVTENVANGPYRIAVVCVGGDDSHVRIRLADEDSGRGLACAAENRSDSFTVSVAGQLRMTVTVSTSGPVIFRYVIVEDD